MDNDHSGWGVRDYLGTGYEAIGWFLKVLAFGAMRQYDARQLWTFAIGSPVVGSGNRLCRMDRNRSGRHRIIWHPLIQGAGHREPPSFFVSHLDRYRRSQEFLSLIFIKNGALSGILSA